MIKAEHAVEIEKPLHDVFLFVGDFATLPRYDPYVVSVERTSDGPITEGSTWVHTRVQGKRRIVAPITMTEYVPDRKIAIASGSKGFDVRSTMIFARHGVGTKVSEVLEMRLSGMMRLLEPLVRRQVQPQLLEVHGRLKKLLETNTV
jgi:uncharacterized membrane protein